MSANLFALLRAAAGEAPITPRIGKWRQAISKLVAGLLSEWLPPATGTTRGSNPLVNYSTAGLDPGAQVFVEGGIDEFYWWDPSSTLTADQLNVVRPNGVSVGAFIRESVVVNPAWFVDSVNGNDQNNGTSSGAPLQTLAMLAEHFNGKTVLQDTTITDVNPSGSTFADPLVLQCTVLQGRRITFVAAAPTINATGSLTAAFTAMAPATNGDAQLTDAAQTWAPLVGKRIRMTSGAALASITWVMKDLGANVARVGQFIDRSTGIMKNPVAGNTYAVETLRTTIGGIDVNIAGGGFFTCKDTTISPVGTFQDNRVNCIGNNPAVISGPSNAILDGCAFGSTECDFYSSFFCLVGCSNPTGVNMRLYNCQAYVYGHVGFSFIAAQVGSRIGIFATSVSQAAQWASYDQSQIVLVLDPSFASASLGVFDRGNPSCFETDGLGLFAAAVAGSVFFGAGNTATSRALIRSGSLLTYISKPVITGGAGNDATIGGLNKTWAQVPFFNSYDGVTVGTGNGAGIVVRA